LIILIMIREVYKIFKNKLIYYKQNKKYSLIKKFPSKIFSQQKRFLQKRPLFRAKNKKFILKKSRNFRKF
ncbi:MAG: hypothetical protein ABFQ65_04270, partial [Nanoarchaeota archaeon]